MELTTTRRYPFQAVHALSVGLHRERKHGHDYAVEVSFTDVAIARVDQLVFERVIGHLHAKELKGEVDPATGEVLVEWIHQQLLELGSNLKAVALQETRKNRFISSLSEARFV